MHSQRFGKARRMRRRSEFQKAFTSGTRIKGRFLTLLMAPNGSGKARLGIVASRKLGDAVRRNRAKRLIREVFRRSIPERNDVAIDVVAIPRPEFFDAPFSNLASDFQSAFQRGVSRLSGHAR
jgi:ribonuclease P protein component